MPSEEVLGISWGYGRGKCSAVARTTNTKVKNLYRKTSQCIAKKAGNTIAG
jgi:hypothetical protein